MPIRNCIPLLMVALGVSSVSAQNAPWTATLRGAWVQTGPAAAGDLTLASKDSVSQIVVADDESSNVHQAAEFLAGDIENISGHRPQIVKTPAADQVTIRMVTLGHGEIPTAVNAAALQGQWESYKI